MWVYFDVVLVCMREIGIMFIDIVFEMKGLVVIKSCFFFEIKFVIYVLWLKMILSLSLKVLNW